MVMSSRMRSGGKRITSFSPLWEERLMVRSASGKSAPTKRAICSHLLRSSSMRRIRIGEPLAQEDVNLKLGLCRDRKRDAVLVPVAAELVPDDLVELRRPAPALLAELVQVALVLQREAVQLLRLLGEPVEVGVGAHHVRADDA